MQTFFNKEIVIISLDADYVFNEETITNDSFPWMILGFVFFSKFAEMAVHGSATSFVHIPSSLWCRLLSLHHPEMTTKLAEVSAFFDSQRQTTTLISVMMMLLDLMQYAFVPRQG